MRRWETKNAKLTKNAKNVEVVVFDVDVELFSSLFFLFFFVKINIINFRFKCIRLFKNKHRILKYWIIKQINNIDKWIMKLVIQNIFVDIKIFINIKIFNKRYEFRRQWNNIFFFAWRRFIFNFSSSIKFHIFSITKSKLTNFSTSNDESKFSS